MPKTSTASWKCIHISLNWSQHSRRSLIHMIVSLPPYDFIIIQYSLIICTYTHIFPLFFSWSAPWVMLDLRILQARYVFQQMCVAVYWRPSRPVGHWHCEVFIKVFFHRCGHLSYWIIPEIFQCLHPKQKTLTFWLSGQGRWLWQWRDGGDTRSMCCKMPGCMRRAPTTTGALYDAFLFVLHWPLVNVACQRQCQFQ